MGYIYSQCYWGQKWSQEKRCSLYKQYHNIYTQSTYNHGTLSSLSFHISFALIRSHFRVILNCMLLTMVFINILNSQQICPNSLLFFSERLAKMKWTSAQLRRGCSPPAPSIPTLMPLTTFNIFAYFSHCIHFATVKKYNVCCLL